jgi:dipeptidyl aminopeptidase/acylaminoacyl peptidase
MPILENTFDSQKRSLLGVRQGDSSKKIQITWIFPLIIGVTIGLIVNSFIGKIQDSDTLRSPIASITPAPAKLLQKYSFPNLRDQTFSPLPLELVEPIATETGYTSWLFRYQTDNGWISGQLNLPQGLTFASQRLDLRKFPVVIMIRGYVDKEKYQTGVGTKNAAAVFAKNGYITIAPDFLGYGSSDPEPENELESRFLRPQAILQLLASIPDFPQADPQKVFIWAHSNGGQIALSVLQISGRPIPTSLWAPVAKPFPYSILYYTDELEDHGKYLRRLVADFESLYDAEEFSIMNYFDWITAPIQIHQGTADDFVPWQWSIQLTKELQKRNLDVTLYQYPGADHNLQPAWNIAISRDLKFFIKNLNK